MASVSINFTTVSTYNLGVGGFGYVTTVRKTCGEDYGQEYAAKWAIAG